MSTAMNSKHPHAFGNPQAGAARRRNPWWVVPAAFLATLLALPVNAAIVIPDEPLTTGTRVAPNILFVLDDSGSMAFNYMPDSVPSTSSPDVSDLAYTRNTLSYNPAITYKPWMKADGTRMGSASYGAAYGSFNLVGGSTINLGSSSSCNKFNYNSNATTDEGLGTSVCGGVQTFYVPKDPNDDSTFGDGKNYWRYQIPEGAGDIVRGEYGSVALSTLSVSPGTGTLSSNATENNYTASVASGQSLRINIKNTSSSSTTLSYWVYDPSGTQICSGTRDKGQSTNCDVTSTDAGSYRILVQGQKSKTTKYSVSAQISNSCDGSFSGSGWTNCQSSLPNASRTLAQELVNYANWFSYHRTRIKSAKAGASDAFMPMGNRVRVGFRTIWQRGASHASPIPVTSGDGRFINDPANSITNRSDWYSALQSVIAYNGTPLKGALYQAGRYFSDNSKYGAYGPESGSDQFSCRQNFTILTTDGYWNNDSNYTAVNEQDDSSGSTITGSGGKTYSYTAKPPYSSSDSNTLADVAMYFWKRDLRTDLANNVPTSTNSDVHPKDGDPAFWQHMVTFGISIGLAGSTGWSSVEEVPQNAVWPNPNDKEDNDRIDDLLHAAVNGHGAFVAATSPQAFTDGLKRALATIAQRTSSFSNVATNSTSLNTGAQVFAASYTSGIWTGKVQAFAVTHSGGVSATPTWTASIPTFASGTRKVFTFTGTAGATFPTSTQTAALDRSGVGPADFTVSGTNNANYIMGDPSREDRNGGLLRSRLTTVLGDIVGSSPAYVASNKTLFVGANDGMLHAFNAETGAERFAYVPGIIDIAALGTISRGDYEHKYFVDGPVVVSPYDSYVSGKNILVGTLGRGGKGLYALDVTTPDSFGTANALWELGGKSTTNKNLGNVLGAPILGLVRNGTGAPAVVFGNGVNSTNDKAVLMVYNLQTGAVIREIPTDSTTNNGLFAPTGVYASDGKTLVYVYAGDLQGNIWKFDLTSTSPASWTATKIFHAEKTAGTPQPITSAPALAVDIATNQRWVFFGTGRYITAGDADDQSQNAQSMYGFMDDGGSYTRSNLTARTITVSGAYRYFEAQASLPSASKGWYVDLPGKGERIVQDAQINGTFMVTASMMPVGDACEDASGTGFINAIDAFTGTSGGTSMFDLNNDGSTDDTGAGGNPIGSVNTGVGMPTLPVLLPGQIVVGGSGDGASSGLAGARTFGMTWQRVSWREIRND